MFYDVPMNHTVANIGENIDFTCSAFGTPMPDITWYKDGVLLNTRTANITTETTTTIGGPPSLLISLLVLEDLQLADNGEYGCHISNCVNDSDTRTFTLAVQSM